jgi:hypothetical protein
LRGIDSGCALCERSERVTYRDDLEAAQARAEAAERKAASLEREVAQLRRPKKGRRDAERDVDTPIPERFRVDHTDRELRVSWRWFKALKHIPLLLFVIVWDAVLVVWYAAVPFTDGGLIALLFPLGHVAVGVGLTYSVLMGFFNRTTVTARGGELSVRHAPLPWRGNRVIAARMIEQLYVTEHAHEHEGSTTHSYDVCAIVAGNEVKLLRGLDELGQARYLERAFEQHLEIPDRHVDGELAKRAK